MLRARAMLSSVLTLATCLLGACSVGGPAEDLTVTLRDAQTLQPLPGASVSVEIIEPRNPVSVTGVVRELLGSEPPAGGSAQTGTDGTVTMPVVTQLPCNVVVVVPGYGVHTFHFGDHPALVNDGAWMQPPSENGLFVTKSFQARFTGPAPKPAESK